MGFKTMILSAALLLTACTAKESQLIGQDSELRQEESAPTAEATKKSEEKSLEEQFAEKTPASASTEDWNLILVGPAHKLPDAFSLELVEVENGQKIDARIKEAWTNWYHAALEAGYRLFFASGYRSIALQEANFNQTIQENINAGMAETEAKEKAKEYLTEPGYSEHHTGLALDIVDEEWIVAGNGLSPDYETQASQQWMTETMADFGFILRYPKGKAEITGILYEPWHFRYVGEANARFIVEHNLTLEEYIDLLILRDQMTTEE